MDFLKGYVTYIAGFGTLITGAVGFVLNLVDSTHAQALPMDSSIQMILGALVALGLRRSQETTQTMLKK